MAVNFNFFGAYSHYSGENKATGRAAQYDKVNILGGLFRYEKAKKAVNGKDRERSLEVSGLFGAMKYRVERGNGVKDRLIKMPLYRKNERTLQAESHSLKYNDIKAFFWFKKNSNDYAVNGVTQQGAFPPVDVEKKMEAKEKAARNVYGDKFTEGANRRPNSMHKYALKQSLQAPPLNNVAVKSMTSGGILRASALAVDSFLAQKAASSVRSYGPLKVSDEQWRNAIWKTSTVLAVGTMVTTAMAAASLTGGLAAIAIGTFAYNRYRRGKNLSDIKTLDGKYQSVINEVQGFEDVKARVGAHAKVDQERIVTAVEDLHFEMEKQLQARKTISRVEMFAAAGASMGIGMSLANSFPGINTMAYVGAGLGSLHAVSKYANSQKKIEPMQETVNLFAQVQQNILQKPIVSAPAPNAQQQKPNGNTP